MLVGASILFALVGFLAGPVLNHLGSRAAVRAPFDGPVSRCQNCASVFTAPSWLAMTCRACGHARTRREPFIWLLSGLGAGGAVWVTGLSPLLPAHLALVGFTVVLVVTDLDAFLLPNRVLFPGTLISIALLGMGSALTGTIGGFGRGLAMGVGYMVVLGLVSFLVPQGFGLGDAKMALMLGTFAGYWSFNAFATMLLATALLGGLPAWFLLLTRRASRQDHLPYGPAMIIGTWLAIGIEGRFALLG